MPGVIDPHAHLGYMDTLEHVGTETRASACGGVTCLGIYILALKDGMLKQFSSCLSAAITSLKILAT